MIDGQTLTIVVNWTLTLFWGAGAFAVVYAFSVWPKRLALICFACSVILMIAFGAQIITDELVKETMGIVFQIVSRFEGGNILLIVCAGITGKFVSTYHRNK